ncbi:IreB family regulatory phosphoprotein [Miniphocaeibacter halophilus]|uniref:IreB family regulatory phosphoprotein n=2 Tax=Miniphocaeibacter halophilus TaxID=2931922 RepID=A0AC61N3Y0_9FIRM|nr:IreB family regulatory phosphoprotein [Miniphocaeibacter halophilus]
MFEPQKEDSKSIKEILEAVYNLLEEKGYKPVNQIIGYILSDDPTYITSHGNARNIIRQIDRDDLLEELLEFYLKENKIK